MTPFSITTGPGPLVAAAVHHGHAVDPGTLPHFALDEAGRLREEDPFTAEFTEVAETRIVGHRSRFEIDLNRPPEQAVYRTPEDAWGLQVWHGEVPEAVVERSMKIYDAFYNAVESLLDEKIRTHGTVVVYDLHSYNYRREGADGTVADPETHPEVNVGTGTLDRERWGPLVDRFMNDLREGARRAGLGTLGPPGHLSPEQHADFSPRGGLDVRENVKFQGGYFPRWIHERFGSEACVLAVEFKKTFVDEWTGEPDWARHRRLREALAYTVPGVLEVHAAITEVP